MHASSDETFESLETGWIQQMQSDIVVGVRFYFSRSSDTRCLLDIPLVGKKRHRSIRHCEKP